MKFSFTNKIRLIIFFIFLISLLQGFIILKSTNIDLSDPNLVNLMVNNIKTTVYITLFLLFTFSLSLSFYLPVFLRTTLKPIIDIILEISQGNYNIQINEDSYKDKLDKEFYEIVLSIKKMLKVVFKFDELKKEKVIEQKNRINALLNISEDGFIIMNISGEIIYINDKLSDIFPALKEKINILATNFNPDIENSIKKYLLNILNLRSAAPQQQFFIPLLKKHITLKSALVKSSQGNPIGIVLAVSNLEKKKIEKKTEKETEK